MTIEQFLDQNTRILDSSGVGTARLDVLVLLEDCLNKNRTHLLAHPDLKLTNEQIKWLNARISRRAKHEPLAYVRGKTEFYGREFIINKNVLEPRPESETMIDLLKGAVIPAPDRSRGQAPAGIQSNRNSLKNWIPDQVRDDASGTTIVDVGTGSGALAITAKLEFPNANVIGIDIDPKCLKVAAANSDKLKTEVEFLEGDLLKPLSSSFYVRRSTFLLANLPYVPENYQINEAAGAEPRIAIFGGSDGLDIYRRLFAQIKKLAYKPDVILTESMPPQHENLAKIAIKVGFKLSKTDDFIQLFTASHSSLG